jgi:hypothetical protein
MSHSLEGMLANTLPLNFDTESQQEFVSPVQDVYLK